MLKDVYRCLHLVICLRICILAYVWNTDKRFLTGFEWPRCYWRFDVRRQAPEAVVESLETLVMPFDRNADGHLLHCQFGRRSTAHFWWQNQVQRALCCCWPYWAQCPSLNTISNTINPLLADTYIYFCCRVWCISSFHSVTMMGMVLVGVYCTFSDRMETVDYAILIHWNKRKLCTDISQNWWGCRVYNLRSHLLQTWHYRI